MIVSHSLRAASYADRVLFIKDGVIFHEIYRGNEDEQRDFMERISEAQLILSKKQSGLRSDRPYAGQREIAPKDVFTESKRREV